MLTRVTLIAALYVCAWAIVPAYGQAQGNTKADAIIRSLTPGNPTGANTRGIRVAKPGQGAAAAGASASQRASVSLNVEFATGSASLTPSAVNQLDELGRALGDQRLAAYHFRIEGHTDTVGTRTYNKALSQRRAEAVANYLESKYQIDPTRLSAVGMGEDGLLVATPDQTADQRNRRVLVVNVGS